MLRALAKEPAALETFWEEIHPAMHDPRVAAARQRAEAALRDTATLEVRARHVVESLALLWQAALLVQHAPPAVADAFVAARLAARAASRSARCRRGPDFAAIIERARPQV